MKQKNICAVYLEEGKKVPKIEECGTASEAIERANKWRALGYKAQAYLHGIDTKTGEIYVFILE